MSRANIEAAQLRMDLIATHRDTRESKQRLPEMAFFGLLS